MISEREEVANATLFLWKGCQVEKG